MLKILQKKKGWILPEKDFISNIVACGRIRTNSPFECLRTCIYTFQAGTFPFFLIANAIYARAPLAFASFATTPRADWNMGQSPQTTFGAFAHSASLQQRFSCLPTDRCVSNQEFNLISNDPICAVRCGPGRQIFSSPPAKKWST